MKRNPRHNKLELVSDAFYSIIVALGRPAFWVSSRPTVLHADRVPLNGPVILASSHTSPYDVPILMRHTPRRLDFVSIAELFRRPIVRWFFTNMNTFALDRTRADPDAVRTIVDRLERGRAVAMFPEGRIRPEADSVLHGGTIRRGIAGIARLANAPIVPVVIHGATVYSKPLNWLPLRRVRYGIIFGQPLRITSEQDDARYEADLAATYPALLAELKSRMT